MSRNVLWTIVALACLALAGCGEDSSPPGGGAAGNEGEGSAEGEGDTGEGEGEGEGSPNEGEGEPGGEGEGEGARPPGADGEPCGDGNTCQEGYECMTCAEGNVESVPDERSPGDTKSCEGRICTCPQWFEGTWWAEFEPRAVDREFDFDTGGFGRSFWMDQEVTFEQDGCTFESPNDGQFLWAKGSRDSGWVDPPPYGFFYERLWLRDDNIDHPLRSRGTLSQDHNTITGTCEGEYPVQQGAPELFNITCTFSLTRR